MKRQMISLVIVLTCCSLLLLTSCSAGRKGIINAHKVELKNIPVTDRTVERNIKIINRRDLTSEPYQILGKVYVKKRVNIVAEKRKLKKSILIDLLKKQAALMGADALININHGNDNPEHHAGPKLNSSLSAWASALPIKLLESSNSELQNSIDFGVVILPVVDNTKDKPTVSKSDESLRKFARYYLENKGYFTFPQNNTRLITSDEIATMDLNALRKVGGDETKLILLLTVESVSRLYTVIVNTAKVAIRARLISKESNKIIWEKNMSYDHISLGAFTFLNMEPCFV
jgi:hypothetical protein